MTRKALKFIQKRDKEEILSHSDQLIDDVKKNKSIYIYESDLQKIKESKAKIRLLLRKGISDSYLCRIAIALLEQELNKDSEKINNNIVDLARERS
ncbi:MAG: hypothetical protein DWQ06_16660 [Calditrichaeota bacterium]|nr:MAG: hypothetical protein DWQ06_16660 [Calditrichota bacterium]